jgi:hypothetical protein
LGRYPDRDVIVLGDRDRSEAGSLGAEHLARNLQTRLQRSVAWALPAKGFKDVREQVLAEKWYRGLFIMD